MDYLISCYRLFVWYSKFWNFVCIELYKKKFIRKNLVMFIKGIKLIFCIKMIDYLEIF